jgi:hypothetical protein
MLSAGGSTSGSLGRTDRMEVSVGGGDGVEKVDGCIPHGMVVAVDVKELAAGAVEAVEGRLVGIDGGPQEHRKDPGDCCSAEDSARTKSLVWEEHSSALLRIVGSTEQNKIGGHKLTEKSEIKIITCGVYRDALNTSFTQTFVGIALERPGHVVRT